MPAPPRWKVQPVSAPDFRLEDEASVWRAVLTGPFMDGTWRHVEVEESRIERAAFTGAQLPRLKLTDVVAEAADFSGVDAEESILTRVEFRGCRMSGLQAVSTRLQDVTFTNCKLDGSNFRMSEADRVTFDTCDLRDADFYAASLHDVRFFDSELSGAEFSKALVPGGQFHGSNLHDIKGGADLRDIVIDAAQVVPLAHRVFAAMGIRVADERDTPVAPPAPLRP
jgi:uncharacterized protein YjbI with pentapeptide repeats